MPERDEPDVVRADAAALGDATAAGLAPLRERIDAIDHEIVALLNERAQIALEIGRVKQRTGRRTVRDAKREAEVLERVTSASAGLFPEPELVALYRKLIAATRRVQHAQKRQAAGAADRPDPAPAKRARGGAGSAGGGGIAPARDDGPAPEGGGIAPAHGEGPAPGAR